MAFDFVSDLLADTFVDDDLWCSLLSRFVFLEPVSLQKAAPTTFRQSQWPGLISMEPRISSASSRALLQEPRVRCFSSVERVDDADHRPLPDVLMIQFPQPRTLNLNRSLSFRLRSTWRLSFSDCASAMCNSKVSNPTGMDFRGTAASLFFFRRGRQTEPQLPPRESFCTLEAFQDVADLYVV